jgi:hypothetical protein
MNTTPAEPQSFTEYVDDWNAVCGEIALLKRQIKAIEAREKAMRAHIATAVETALGEHFKEGTNNLPLPDGRVVKVVHKMNRKVDPASLDAAREAYRKVNDVPVLFDDLLRTKYEIAKAEMDKLEGEAAKAFALAYTSTPAAATVELSV